MARPTNEELERKELEAKIALLEKQLSEERFARAEAENFSASQVVVNSAQEVPTGRSVTVEKCINPWVKDEKKQKFQTVEIPTFFFTIDLPPGAGVCLYTNGVEFYHGQTYEFREDELAEIKDRVAKCWYHEKSIHGDNENAYRQPAQTHLMSRAAAQRQGVLNTSTNIKVM